MEILDKEVIEVKKFFLFLILAMAGCVGVRHQTGLDKTTNEPLHAESGAAITLWKIPLVGIGGWGNETASGWFGYGAPSIIVHQYDYQAQSQATPPGTPPTPPTTNSSPSVDYKTNYETAFDDPTLVIFANQSYRVIRIRIGDEPEIRLGPYRATTNLHLAPGEYNIRKTVEKPVKLGQGAIFDWVTFLRISVTLNGHSQIIYLQDN